MVKIRELGYFHSVEMRPNRTSMPAFRLAGVCKTAAMHHLLRAKGKFVKIPV